MVPAMATEIHVILILPKRENLIWLVLIGIVMNLELQHNRKSGIYIDYTVCRHRHNTLLTNAFASPAGSTKCSEVT